MYNVFISIYICTVIVCNSYVYRYTYQKDGDNTCFFRKNTFFDPLGGSGKKFSQWTWISMAPKSGRSWKKTTGGVPSGYVKIAIENGH